MRRFLIVILVVVSELFIHQVYGLPRAITPVQETYKTYTNARFAFSIAYPAHLLVPQGEATNGDGQRFISKDEQAVLLAYGSYNALDQTLNDIFKETSETSPAHPNRMVTYKALRADWFVVSGKEDGKIFYQKTLLKKAVLKTFRLEYRESQKATFDPVVARLEKSFRG
jgi:hypothetical protein